MTHLTEIPTPSPKHTNYMSVYTAVSWLQCFGFNISPVLMDKKFNVDIFLVEVITSFDLIFSVVFFRLFVFLYILLNSCIFIYFLNLVAV